MKNKYLIIKLKIMLKLLLFWNSILKLMSTIIITDQSEFGNILDSETYINMNLL